MYFDKEEYRGFPTRRVPTYDFSQASESYAQNLTTNRRGITRAHRVALCTNQPYVVLAVCSCKARSTWGGEGVGAR